MVFTLYLMGELMHLLQQQFVIIEANLAHHGGLENPKKFG
jgi:hypothetical protein